MSIRKPRRKKDGSVEWPADCACCGSSKLEINGTSLAYHCWSCNFAGVLTHEEFERVKGAGWETPSQGSSAFPPFHPSGPASDLPGGAPTLTDKLPQIALQEIERRRQEPAWIIHRYGVRWDGSRLCWPAGQGWSRRAVLSWETPKTISVSPRGLIGEHLLSSGRVVAPYPLPGATRKEPAQAPKVSKLDASESFAAQPGLRLVLTEGDWGAASIPLPWIGLGLMGTSLSEEQRWSIATSNPKSVAICLDAGYKEKAVKIREQLLPIPSCIVELPGPVDTGPDDVKRGDLVRLLLASESRL